jgi:hypothetical protein
MGKTNESTFANNVTNFQTLVSRVAGMGNGYAPTNGNITLASLKSLLIAAQAALTDSNTTQAFIKKTVDDRFNAFSNVRRYATQIVNAFRAQVNDAEAVATMVSINNKMRSRKKKDAKPELGSDSKKPVSSSQQGFPNLVEHLEQMEKIVTLHNSYAPNEADLKIGAIQKKIVDLRAANDSIIQAQTALVQARLERNRIHFQKEVGINDVAKAVKSYVAATFGLKSAEYKQISGLRFRSGRL